VPKRIIYKAFIFDVMVSAEYRGQGLGQKVMQLVKRHEKLQKVK
jgi:ribosomal protein S18 acetylase RimI-like enzyme